MKAVRARRTAAMIEVGIGISPSFIKHLILLLSL
jgi:hypothetical protein